MGRVSSPVYDGFGFNLDKWAVVYNDFMSALQAQDRDWTSATSVGVVADSGTVSTNHPGTLTLSTGASATGYATVFHRQLNWQAINQKLSWIVRSPTVLSTAGQRYALRIGLMDSATATDGTDGLFFRYRDDLNGGKWQCVARAAGVDNAVDSGVTYAASTFYNLRIEIGAVSTSADFYINGTKVQTIASGLPGSASIRPTAAILKSVGATDITGFWLDAVRMACRVTR